MTLEVPNAFALSCCRFARRERSPNDLFPAARDVIFGAAFAISDELFLTAAHVVQAAASVGDVALGQLTVPVGDSRYGVATAWEVLEGIGVAVTGHERGRRLSHSEGLRARFL
jgi:hypothetical protein